jgi:hypothetical protein
MLPLPRLAVNDDCFLSMPLSLFETHLTTPHSIPSLVFIVAAILTTTPPPK